MILLMDTNPDKARWLSGIDIFLASQCLNGFKMKMAVPWRLVEGKAGMRFSPGAD